MQDRLDAIPQTDPGRSKRRTLSPDWLNRNEGRDNVCQGPGNPVINAKPADAEHL